MHLLLTSKLLLLVVSFLEEIFANGGHHVEEFVVDFNTASIVILIHQHFGLFEGNHDLLSI